PGIFNTDQGSQFTSPRRIESNMMVNPFARSEYFQTDAAINTGNSGGPMFNMEGEVIGIVSHILSQSGGFEGLGFAATSNIASDLLLEEQVMWTGIEGYLLAGELAALFNLPQSAGFMVQKVVFDSPLGLLGIQGGQYEANIEGEELLLGGDIILGVNGYPIALTDAALAELANHMKNLEPTSPLEVEILRKGRRMTLKR
ncbi:MAG: trypsin-like serine protease, partial [Bacteroidota bacterium]